MILDAKIDNGCHNMLHSKWQNGGHAVIDVVVFDTLMLVSKGLLVTSRSFSKGGVSLSTDFVT